jgi:hypothetical protein
MYFFYCDETNLQDHNQFLIYGGLSIPEDNASDLSDRVDEIRREAEVEEDFLLKFNPGPPNLDHQEFISLKQDIIEVAIEHECKIFTSMIHHGVIDGGNVNLARRNEINRVIFNFHQYLGDEYGLVLFDRFDDGEIDNHLREKFSIGLRGLPHADPYQLNNILGLHYSTIGQAHFPSIVDIVLGSFRFAINAFSLDQDEHLDTAETILGLLEPLFMRNEEGRVSRSSLNFSPMVIRHWQYRQEYTELQEFMELNGLSSEQEILAT